MKSEIKRIHSATLFFYIPHISNKGTTLKFLLRNINPKLTQIKPPPKEPEKALIPPKTLYPKQSRSQYRRPIFHPAVLRPSKVSHGRENRRDRKAARGFGNRSGRFLLRIVLNRGSSGAINKSSEISFLGRGRTSCRGAVTGGKFSLAEERAHTRARSLARELLARRCIERAPQFRCGGVCARSCPRRACVRVRVHILAFPRRT